MIGLDTNVLLRLFVNDDPVQSELARRFVAEATEDEACVVNSVVLVEFAWALAKQMKRPRDEVVRLVGEVLSADDLDISYRNAARNALSAFRRGRADFADYYLAEINAELGCSTTATFDKDALDSKAFSPVA